MATRIYEVGQGDYVKFNGRWLKISSIDFVPDADNAGKFKSWTVNTADGRRISMLQAQCYARAAEPRA